MSGELGSKVASCRAVQHCHRLSKGFWDSSCTKVRDIEGMSTQPRVRCLKPRCPSHQSVPWDVMGQRGMSLFIQWYTGLGWTLGIEA